MSGKDHLNDSRKSRGRECRRLSLPSIAKSSTVVNIKSPSSDASCSLPPSPANRHSSNGCIKKVPVRRSSYNIQSQKLVELRPDNNTNVPQSSISDKGSRSTDDNLHSRPSRYSFCSTTTLNIRCNNNSESSQQIRSSSQPGNGSLNYSHISSSDLSHCLHSQSMNHNKLKTDACNDNNGKHSCFLSTNKTDVDNKGLYQNVSSTKSATPHREVSCSLESSSSIAPKSLSSCSKSADKSCTKNDTTLSHSDILPNRITTSLSSGCIPSSVANTSSSNSSLTSSSSANLQDINGGLQDSTWAARAASIALSLTRVSPTVPPYNPRRSMSPSPLPPANSAPHSPQMSLARTNFTATCYSTPPSPQNFSSHRLSSPIGSSVSLTSGNSTFMPSQSQQNLTVGHSRPPSPILPRALSPRRHSSPGYSNSTSPNLRPRSSQRVRSQRTPSPRPPLPPSSSNDVSGPSPPVQRARNRPRVEIGNSIISKMRGR